jgi:SPP1 gp7 family putative phage head morphogenesis protein
LGWELRLDGTIQGMRDTLYAMLRDGAQLGADYGRQQIDEVLGTATKTTDDGSAAISLVDWDLVNTDAADWARAHAGDLVGQLNETTATALRAALGEYITNGLTFRDLLGELEPLFGADRARRIAVTETTRAYAQGNIAAWKRSGVITMMEWHTANDERVCPVCAPLEGQQFPVDGGQAPPAHVSCRCWLVPVLQGATQ